MTATASPEDRAEPLPVPATDTCTACGANLAADQEWCLECGAARTVLHPPPDWRLAVLVVGAVIVAALAVFAVALVRLNSPSPGSATTVTVPATARARPASIAGWPPGLSGWTVVLAAVPTEPAAEALAGRLAAAGAPVGVLSGAGHPRLHTPDWIVFSGRYASATAAEAAAGRLSASGHPGATAREVAAPGGI